MRSLPQLLKSTILVSAAINGALCIVIGTLLGGLRGGQLGLVVGILLAVLPAAVRASTTWLARPGGMPRLIMHEVGAVAVRSGATVSSALGKLIGPVVRLMQVPFLMLRFAAFVVSGIAKASVDAVGRTLATPLGLANIGALLVIAINLLGFDFATLSTFVGFGLLVLVLLVSNDEGETEDNTGLGGHS